MGNGNNMSLNYCCFGMYLDLDHSDDCPTKKGTSMIDPTKVYCCVGKQYGLPHSDECEIQSHQKVYSVNLPQEKLMMSQYEQTQYEVVVLNLIQKTEKPKDDMMLRAVGISKEAGELLDAVNKFWSYGKPLNMENILEELGDIYFFFTAARLQYGFSLNAIRQYNMNKLSKRYPSGKFNAEDAIARADKMDGE